MFYSYDILNMRTGRLAIVWLVATSRLKLNAGRKTEVRDVLGTNLPKVCDEIIRSIVIRENGLSNITLEHPSKRFSLYLSSMLMYGAVKIYDYQLKMLLDKASDAFVSLQTQTQLLDVLSKKEVNRMTVVEVSNIDSMFFGGIHDSSFLNYEMLDEAPRQFCVKPVDKEQGLIREHVENEEDNLQNTSALNDLILDWEDNGLNKHRHSNLNNITLIEDTDLLLTSHKEILQVGDHIGDVSFGGPFLPNINFDDQIVGREHLEEPDPNIFLEKNKDLEVDEINQTVAIENRDAEVPAILETPAAHTTARDVNISPKKKSKEPLVNLDDEVTLLESQTKSVSIQDRRKRCQSQIDLQPFFETQKSKKPKTTKKKLIFADEIDQIPKDVLKDNIKYFHDTMREKSSYDDKMDVRLLKNLIDPKKLFLQPRRAVKCFKLSMLLQRHYVTPHETAIYDFQSPDSPLSRSDRPLQDQLTASTIRDGPGNVSEFSTIGSISRLINDQSDLLPNKKATPDLLAPPSVIYSGVENILFEEPNEELQVNEQMGPTENPMTDFEPLETPKISLNGHERKRRKIFSPEGVLTTMTIEAEVHDEPKKRKKSSPDVGFTHHTFEAEVHPQPHLRETISSCEGRVEKEPLALEVVEFPEELDQELRKKASDGGSQPSSLEKQKQSVASRLEAMDPPQSLVLDDFLPSSPSRGHVAATFSMLLNLHKNQKVKLSQGQSFGPIVVKLQKIY